jgi:hypothetical protein
MRRRLTLVLLLLCLIVPLASADVGVGIIIGDPTGISALFNEKVALGVAWDLERHFHAHVDVWLLNRTLEPPLEWFLGVGGKFKVFTEDTGGPPWDEKEEPDADFGIGARLPIGLQWYPLPELEVFGEIAPGLQVLPATRFDVDAGIGVRYHF